MNSLEITDQESAAVVKFPNNRVKLADIEAAIKAEYTVTAYDLINGYDILSAVDVIPVQELKPLTVCFIVMKNGFVVIGKSAPADPANFDAELGKKFAREDAIRQLWPLMGYSLRDKFMED